MTRRVVVAVVLAVLGILFGAVPASAICLTRIIAASTPISGQVERLSGRPPKVAIIGGGPAGLVLGYFLQRRRVPFVILERGETVGYSWTQMPATLRLVSLWSTNRLPGSPVDGFSDNEQVSAAAFAEYLRRYAEYNRLPVLTGVSVERVRATAGGFQLETDHGAMSVPVVVSATGYFGHPNRPAIPGLSTIPQWHFAQYHDAQWLRGELAAGSGNTAGNTGGRAPRVLVVGQRLSAGQLLEELAPAGFQLALSHRSPLRFGPRPELQRDILEHLLENEAASMRNPAFRFDPNALMGGGRPRHLVESGQVRSYPAVERFDGDAVIFAGGARERFDAILYATGFQPVTGHLAGAISVDPETGIPLTRGMQSIEAPGLFFLGLDRLVNLRSRFLRGIREDAEPLSETLSIRVALSP